jgi:hypothetical protein
LIDNQEIKAILVPDKDNNNNNKKLADQPLLNIEQQKALKQTHEENKKCKGRNTNESNNKPSLLKRV